MSDSAPTKPTLTDSSGLGGIIAQAGFDYQLWDALTLLSGWLTNPTFDSFLIEGQQDVEVRFFAPHAPHHYIIDRYQAKSGVLKPVEVREVFEAFQQLDNSYPLTTRLFTLVTTQLPPTLTWLGRDATRVRNARPFYSPFADIIVANDSKFLTDVVETYGNELGQFVAERIEVREQRHDNRTSAQISFAISLQRAFPHPDFNAKQIGNAFNSLETLLRSSMGKTLNRKELIETLQAALSVSIVQKPFRIQIHSGISASDETALEIDARAFSRKDRVQIDLDLWQTKLLEPLNATAEWLSARKVKYVVISGNYRIPTALAMGWSLRSAKGFELELPTKDGNWATDDRPTTGDTLLPWQIREADRLVEDRLVVSIGVIRDPISTVASQLGVSNESILQAYLPVALPSAKSVQSSVSIIKQSLDRAIVKLRPRTVELYFAGPAVFAAALGHRWNAMPPSQIFEFDAVEQQYFAAVILK